MAEELARIILNVFKDYDYRLVGKARIQELWKPKTEEIAGLCCTGNKPTIYIRKGMRHDETHHVQLHEIAHAYLDSINKGFYPEEEVERLAYEWQVKLDGVYHEHH